jgi:hypothetical protein
MAQAQLGFRARRQKMAFQMILSFGGVAWRGGAPPSLPLKGHQMEPLVNPDAEGTWVYRA